MDDRRARGYFWPVLLIAVGVVWLLGNLNIIQPFNFGLLFNLWPLLLVLAGINIILGNRAPVLRMILNIAIVVFAILYVYFARPLGLAETIEVQEASFSEPIGDATAATIQIQSSVGQTHIHALDDSSNLIEAEIAYIGDITFDVQGTESKTVVLDVDNDTLRTNFWDDFNTSRLRWDIGLTPEIPLVLDFSGGVGDIDLDLSGLTFNEIFVNGGVGTVNISLPAQEGLYQVQVRGGVGKFNITIEEGATIELDVNAGVGDFVMEVPDETGVELHASTSVGSVRLPSAFLPIRTDDLTVGVNGTWQTENFATASDRLFINFRGGVGNLRIR